MMYPIQKGFSCKYLAILLAFFLPVIATAQVSLTNVAPTVSIDFSNSMPTTVGTNPSTPFGGKGFEPNPTTAGRLNSNAWAVTSWSDAPYNLTFGGTATTTTTNDFARGATNAAQSTG